RPPGPGSHIPQERGTGAGVLVVTRRCGQRFAVGGERQGKDRPAAPAKRQALVASPPLRPPQPLPVVGGPPRCRRSRCPGGPLATVRVTVRGLRGDPPLSGG